MSTPDPVGAFVARHSTSRQRKSIQLAVKVANIAVSEFAPDTTYWRRFQLALIGIDALIYELDAVADDDDVRGDSISQTMRSLFHTDSPFGRALWSLAFNEFAKWFEPHIDTPHIAVVTN